MADPDWQAAWGTFTYLWFVQQLPCFLFGILAFKWIADGRAVRWPRALVLISLFSMVLVAFVPSLPYVGRLGLPMQYGIIFAFFALGLSQWQPIMLINPIVGWIGKVSFSAYLIHLAVISIFAIPHSSYTEAFLALTAVTIMISSITYLTIEVPFNQLGRYLAKQLRAVRPARYSVNDLDPSLVVHDVAIRKK